jgi:hypothetical protein
MAALENRDRASLKRPFAMISMRRQVHGPAIPHVEKGEEVNHRVDLIREFRHHHD